MFVSTAFAQSAVPLTTSSSVMANVLQILLIFLVFYLLLIRPQQKKLKQHEAELKAIKVGDKIMTAGGVYGIIKAIEDDDLSVEIAKGVDVKLHRYTVREVLKDEPVKENKSKNKGKKHV